MHSLKILEIYLVESCMVYKVNIILDMTLGLFIYYVLKVNTHN